MGSCSTTACAHASLYELTYIFAQPGVPVAPRVYTVVAQSAAGLVRRGISGAEVMQDWACGAAAVAVLNDVGPGLRRAPAYGVLQQRR